jgi:hypothetical protein
MEADVAEYLIKYYSFLLTDTERLALKHLQHNEKLLANEDTESRERMREMYLRMGWLTSDARVLTLLQDGQEMFIQRAAQRIYAENGGEQLLNTCPACNRLARTPQARQCRYCNFDWH